MVTKKSHKSQVTSHKLKNKRILITAGPTWVPIDAVRVISNIATGETGILLAQQLEKLGARITLLMGPVGACCLNNKIKIIRFKFFDELRDIINKELRAKKYDVVIHSAAVSDFKSGHYLNSKLSSDKIYNLKLAPLPKIVRDIRYGAPKAKLVIFKLEEGVPDKILIRRARESLLAYRADLVVANEIHPDYKAFILDKEKVYFQVNSKKGLVKKMIKLI